MIDTKKKVVTKDCVKAAKESLLQILFNCYRKYSSPSVNKDEEIRFNISSFSETSKFIKDEYRAINVEDLQSLLQTVIIFIYSDLNLIVELESFIKQNKTFHKEEVEAYLSTKENKEPLAVFYEGIGEIEESLKIWKEIKGDKAIQKTIQIVNNSNDNKNYLLTYCKWILKEKPDKVIAIILKYDKVTLHPDEVVEFLRENESEDHPLVLKYLKAFIEKKNDDSKTLHNTLAFEYINQIYQMKSPKKAYIDKCDNEAKLKHDREVFQDFLKRSDFYEVNMVLNKIRNSWMMEEIIILLIKANKYTEALETFLDKGMEKEAEAFCTKMEPERQLITTLFEIYITRFKKYDENMDELISQSSLSKVYADTRIQRDKNEKLAMSLLKKYACDPALNSERVLKSFPESWGSTEGNNYTLMTYLSTVLDHKLSLQENSSIGKGLSSMEYRNMKYKLAGKRKAYVKITSDQICSF